MQLHAWFLLPAVVAATTTTTVTRTRDCSDANGGGGSVTVDGVVCSTTDCASAGAAIPTCAQSCISSIASDLGCSAGDAICTCDNMPFIQPSVAPCVSSACPMVEYAPVTQAVNGLCACATALASDQACIASASAGAGGRSRTTSPTSSKHKSPVSSNTAIQSAAQSQPSDQSQSQPAVQSNTQSQPQSQQQSQPNSQPQSQPTGQNSATQSAAGTGNQQSTGPVIPTGTGAPVSISVPSVQASNPTNSNPAAGTGAKTTVTVSGSKEVYSACPFTTTVASATIPATAPGSGPTTYNYLGCYKDDEVARVVQGEGYNNSNTAVADCGRYCYGQGAPFFAVEYHGECFCGADMDDSKGCSTECNLDCYDGTNTICGGDYAAQVYVLQGT